MRNRFDRQLEMLGEMMIHMGELCETAIEEVTGALENNDMGRAKAVIAADEEIDQMEKDIENLCLKLLLQQQPVARDLRQISAALKMITDMERIGDQTADIADIVTAAEFNGDENLKDIGRMAEATMRMVRSSVSAYVQKDLELARKVMDADDAVDEFFDNIKKELVESIKDHKGTGGDTAIDLIMIAKYLERIGDHATNIAEWVEFSITGIHAGNARI
ncbi:MAG: phosphate signaling complex protein PhoU [Bariatricus sp.]|nr:phosphate signaling complex protein PhoU [Bariatricus sp.]